MTPIGKCPVGPTFPAIVRMGVCRMECMLAGDICKAFVFHPANRTCHLTGLANMLPNAAMVGQLPSSLEMTGKAGLSTIRKKNMRCVIHLFIYKLNRVSEGEFFGAVGPDANFQITAFMANSVVGIDSDVCKFD